MRLSWIMPSLILSLQMLAPAAAQARARTEFRDRVVGVWIVHHDPAPFPYHMYVFNADETMQQANPDAGNATRSDSDAKGVWATRNGHIVGKWVEITADRATHRYSGRGELSFDIVVDGDRLTGQGSFVGYDPDGKIVAGPIYAPFTGTRVTLPK